MSSHDEHGCPTTCGSFTMLTPSEDGSVSGDADDSQGQQSYSSRSVCSSVPLEDPVSGAVLKLFKHKSNDAVNMKFWRSCQMIPTWSPGPRDVCK